jgi:hypothetical protein
MPEKIKIKEPKRYILRGTPRFKIKNDKVKNKKYAPPKNSIRTRQRNMTKKDEEI